MPLFAKSSAVPVKTLVLKFGAAECWLTVCRTGTSGLGAIDFRNRRSQAALSTLGFFFRPEYQSVSSPRRFISTSKRGFQPVHEVPTSILFSVPRVHPAVDSKRVQNLGLHLGAARSPTPPPTTPGPPQCCMGSGHRFMLDSGKTRRRSERPHFIPCFFGKTLQDDATVTASFVVLRHLIANTAPRVVRCLSTPRRPFDRSAGGDPSRPATSARTPWTLERSPVERHEQHEVMRTSTPTNKVRFDLRHFSHQCPGSLGSWQCRTTSSQAVGANELRSTMLRKREVRTYALVVATISHNLCKLS